MGNLNQSREWYRPNPAPNDITWGPRANVNMQESALLIAMNHVAKNRETFLENYYLKNKHTIERGKTEAPYAYVVPAKQRRPVEAAELMNLIRREGAEVQTANAAFSIGNIQVAPGDYIVRLDQPYGGIVETLLGVQFYAPENPRPYDDTGWAIPLVRNVAVHRIEDKAILDKPMTLATADFTIPGTITGSGRVIIVDHNTENTLVTFRFKNAGVKMAAAEKAFEAGGHQFGPGAFVIADANRAALEPSIKELGLSAWAVDAAPNVPMHDLDVPRIGYVHTWTSTQDEGWVRLAFDNFKVPYTYFGAPKLREGQSPREVRRHHVPARGRRRRRAHQRRRAGQRAAALPEDRTDAERRHNRLDRRHARQHRRRRADGALQVRGAGRRPHHRGWDVHRVPGIQPHARRQHRNA